MSWLLTVAHFFGTRNGDGNSAGYLFWSGAGSDLAYVGVGAAFWRQHNCHTRGCWRLARHPVPGTSYVVCRHHHPEGHPTAAHIRDRYHLYMGGRPGKG